MPAVAMVPDENSAPLSENVRNGTSGANEASKYSLRVFSLSGGSKRKAKDPEAHDAPAAQPKANDYTEGSEPPSKRRRLGDWLKETSSDALALARPVGAKAACRMKAAGLDGLSKTRRVASFSFQAGMAATRIAAIDPATVDACSKLIRSKLLGTCASAYGSVPWHLCNAMARSGSQVSADLSMNQDKVISNVPDQVPNSGVSLVIEPAPVELKHEPEEVDHTSVLAPDQPFKDLPSELDPDLSRPCDWSAQSSDSSFIENPNCAMEESEDSLTGVADDVNIHMEGASQIESHVANFDARAEAAESEEWTEESLAQDCQAGTEGAEWSSSDPQEDAFNDEFHERTNTRSLAALEEHQIGNQVELGFATDSTEHEGFEASPFPAQDGVELCQGAAGSVDVWHDPGTGIAYYIYEDGSWSQCV